jgi:hypothetical protein
MLAQRDIEFAGTEEMLAELRRGKKFYAEE